FPLLHPCCPAPRLLILAAFLHGALTPPAHAAQLYKWTDADGNTHYADHSGTTDKGKAVTLKSSGTEATTPPAGNTAPTWAEKYQQFKERQNLQNANGAGAPPQRVKPPKSLSGGRVDDGSDASRCNLAKDVLSGAVRHRNGAPTDAYDRQTAENDVRAFCR
ncbi:MAG TPA: DUF4124 domain-containing protein, partial [Azospira sp.]|nr:DUF4124 domain-containing protein [Azospira sp.]